MGARDKAAPATSQQLGSRTGRIFSEYVERSLLDPEHSFVAVGRIPRTRFVKQKFVQLRTNYVDFRFDEKPELYSRRKCWPNLERATAVLPLLIWHCISNVPKGSPHRPHIAYTSPPHHLHIAPTSPDHACALESAQPQHNATGKVADTVISPCSII